MLVREKVVSRLENRLVLLAFVLAISFQLLAFFQGSAPKFACLFLAILLAVSIYYSHKNRLQYQIAVQELNTMVSKYHQLSDEILHCSECQFKNFTSEMAEAKDMIGDSINKLSGSLTGLQMLSARQREALIKLISEMLQMSGGTEHEVELEAIGFRRFFNETNALIAEFVLKITELNNNSMEISHGFAQMKTQVERIAGLLNQISTITKQTDLLALNAAIEAARAGQPDAALRLWLTKLGCWPPIPANSIMKFAIL